MTHFQDDQTGVSIRDFATALRQKQISAEEFTQRTLDRIQAENPKLSAYAYVAHDEALQSARHVDNLLRSGEDLGPLMGIPVGIKDLFSVEGMPTTAGSRVDVSELIQPEGPFVSRLKQLGCVVLGKTRTTEFAMGTINLSHETPWNPIDLSVKMMPGGSSNGSAVATAAGLCAFAVGGDTGGSVRLPAAFCDVVGYKASCQLWPLEGVFPLSSTLDSIGLFTRRVGDLSEVFSGITGKQVVKADLRGMKIGLPRAYFLDDLDPEVAQSFDSAARLLEGAGAELVTVDMPGVDDVKEMFARGVPAEFLSFFGRDRFVRHKSEFDPVVSARASAGLDYPAESYISLLRRRRVLESQAHEALDGVAAVLMPTSPAMPVRVDSISDTDSAAAWNARALRNTQPMNLLGLIGISLPIPLEMAGKAGAGLQLVCQNLQDARMLGLALAVEEVLQRG